MRSNLALSFATIISLLLLPLPAVCGPRAPKLEGLDKELERDRRLVVVRSEGDGETRCPGIYVGHFTLFTDYACLEKWWNDKPANRISYSIDVKNHWYESRFDEARRDGRPTSLVRWALMAVSPKSVYAGYRTVTDGEEYTFVGFATSYRGGTELAMVRGCHLVPYWETRGGGSGLEKAYRSQCGLPFDSGGFLVLHRTRDDLNVIGLGKVIDSVQSSKGQTVVNLAMATAVHFGQQATQMREYQEARYRREVEGRQAAAGSLERESARSASPSRSRGSGLSAAILGAMRAETARLEEVNRRNAEAARQRQAEAQQAERAASTRNAEMQVQQEQQQHQAAIEQQRRYEQMVRAQQAQVEQFERQRQEQERARKYQRTRDYRWEPSRLPVQSGSSRYAFTLKDGLGQVAGRMEVTTSIALDQAGRFSGRGGAIYQNTTQDCEIAFNFAMRPAGEGLPVWGDDHFGNGKLLRSGQSHRGEKPISSTKAGSYFIVPERPTIFSCQ